METKTKIISAVGIILAVLVILAINPFKPVPVFPANDDNTILNDENVGEDPLDLFTPEELAAHEEQLRASDPVRYEALKQNDAGICEQELDKSEIDWCKAAVAEKTKDETICQTLSGFALDQCYINVAEAKLGITLCNKILVLDTKDECMENIAGKTGNLDACFEIKDIGRGDNCIAAIALLRNDSSLCKQLRDINFQTDCEQNFELANQ